MLKFEPIRPCRPDIYGEGIFVRLWREYAMAIPRWADGDETVFTHLLMDLPGEPTQRDATVATSFMCWLGTNIGNAFLVGCERHAKTDSDRCRVHAGVWAWENRRRRGINAGRRLSDAILGDCVSARDLEVLEVMAAWLGTKDGLTLVAQAQEEINAVHCHLRETSPAKVRAMRTALDILEGRQ